MCRLLPVRCVDSLRIRCLAPAAAFTYLAGGWWWCPLVDVAFGGLPAVPGLPCQLPARLPAACHNLAVCNAHCRHPVLPVPVRYPYLALLPAACCLELLTHRFYHLRCARRGRLGEFTYEPPCRLADVAATAAPCQLLRWCGAPCCNTPPALCRRCWTFCHFPCLPLAACRVMV